MQLQQHKLNNHFPTHGHWYSMLRQFPDKTVQTVCGLYLNTYGGGRRTGDVLLWPDPANRQFQLLAVVFGTTICCATDTVFWDQETLFKWLSENVPDWRDIDPELALQWYMADFWHQPEPDAV